AHREAIAPAENAAREVAEAVAPFQNGVVGHPPREPRHRAIKRVFGALHQHALLAAAHIFSRMRSMSSITNSAGMAMIERSLIFTASFSVVTIGAPPASRLIRSTSS